MAGCSELVCVQIGPRAKMIQGADAKTPSPPTRGGRAAATIPPPKRIVARQRFLKVSNPSGSSGAVSEQKLEGGLREV